MVGINEFPQVYGIHTGLKYSKFRIPSHQEKAHLLTAQGEYSGKIRRMVRVGRVDSTTEETGFFVPKVFVPEQSIYAAFAITNVTNGEVSATNTRYFDLWMPLKTFQKTRRGT